MSPARSNAARRIVLLSLAWIACLPIAGRAGDPLPVPYRLFSPGSQLETGCQAPCACPTTVFPLRGTFLLSTLGFDGLFQDYEISGVDWRYLDLATMTERPVTGRGLYRVGGEFAAQHQLLLELQFRGEPTQFFDSGVQLGGTSFPRIDLATAIHGFFCLDSVVSVVAEPLSQSAGVDGRPRGPSLSVVPNPFRQRVALAFEHSAAGAVDLRIFDIAGREVRVIESGALLPAGAHARGWDGRDAHGVEARSGLYFARFVTLAGVVRRGFVKLN